MSASPAGDGPHPDEDLSALLDDELSGAEEAAVWMHLDDCPSCREELARLDEARRRLRGLVPVPPPPGLDERVRTRVRGFVRQGALAAGLGALVAAGILWLARPEPRVLPLSLLTAAVPSWPPGPVLTLAQVPPGYLAPNQVGDASLVSVRRKGPVLEAVYAEGGRQMTALEQQGVLSTPGSPARRTELGGKAGWFRLWDGTEAFSGQYGPLVVTLVGDPDDVAAAAPAFQKQMPAAPLTTRIRILCRELVQELTG